MNPTTRTHRVTHACRRWWKRHMWLSVNYLMPGDIEHRISGPSSRWDD